MKDEADLHTPTELLATAQSLIETGEPKFMRASILESLAALESFVKVTVFSLLDKKLDPLFVRWLEKKTRMDFEGRLQYITALALDTDIDTSSHLWFKYQEARKIRNRIAHHGRVASSEEAREVLGTVKEWLSYLGSSAEVDISLNDLKQYFEAFIHKQKPNEHTLIEMVRGFYEKTSPMVSVGQDVRIDNMRADLILDFGNHKVIFEIKRSHRQQELGLRQLEKLYEKSRSEFNTRLILLVFTESEIPVSYDVVTKINDHASVVYIRV